MNEIIEAAAAIDPAELAAALVQEHVADIVERLNAEPLERASAVLSAMPLERAAEVLDEPGLEAAADLVEAQPPERAVRYLRHCLQINERISFGTLVRPPVSVSSHSSILRREPRWLSFLHIRRTLLAAS
jgi:Mg/Co/Ni transporter MgtE